MKRPVWTSLEAITVNQAGGSGVGLSDVAIKNTKCPLKFEFQANFFFFSTSVSRAIFGKF